jgi:hypothetical protein
VFSRLNFSGAGPSFDYITANKVDTSWHLFDRRHLMWIWSNSA